MLIRKNLECSPRSFVRPFVRKYFEIRSLLFSETLQLVKTQKGGKNVPSAFLKKSHYAHFVQKLSKIGHFEPKWSKMPKIEGFPHFFENRTLHFPDFCMNASLRGV